MGPILTDINAIIINEKYEAAKRYALFLARKRENIKISLKQFQKELLEIDKVIKKIDDNYESWYDHEIEVFGLASWRFKPEAQGDFRVGGY